MIWSDFLILVMFAFIMLAIATAIGRHLARSQVRAYHHRQPKKEQLYEDISFTFWFQLLEQPSYMQKVFLCVRRGDDDDPISWAVYVDLDDRLCFSILMGETRRLAAVKSIREMECHRWYMVDGYSSPEGRIAMSIDSGPYEEGRHYMSPETFDVDFDDVSPTGGTVSQVSTWKGKIVQEDSNFHDLWAEETKVHNGRELWPEP